MNLVSFVILESLAYACINLKGIIDSHPLIQGECKVETKGANGCHVTKSETSGGEESLIELGKGSAVDISKVIE